MSTPFQPSLPTPVPYTEPELNYIDESPPGLFAENQDSNFGLKRKIFSDQIDEVSQQLQLIYTESFISSSTQLLGQWEYELGLPTNPSGVSVEQRRARIQARYRTGPFTRTRRRAIVESYISATFGQTITFSPSGVPLSDGGLPFYSDASSLTGLYLIEENIEGFSYAVYILTTAMGDTDGLIRELERITPAHISSTVEYVSTLTTLYPDTNLFPDTSLFPSKGV